MKYKGQQGTGTTMAAIVGTLMIGAVFLLGAVGPATSPAGMVTVQAMA